eukprot:CAMPEP_0115347798 /NCGR_PEP_ID=MMETSP0270-20121206/95070_1 /TAXON_ID=71861 /ORGANISM="Scrippsiella trochoidea, Strain CCMP3099" /LENGTH=42 /DNA_ID= /DNA_START= /DNA_END= /DNA_ORIENTATION=
MPDCAASTSAALSVVSALSSSLVSPANSAAATFPLLLLLPIA